MNKLTSITLALLLPLAACGRNDTPPPPAPPSPPAGDATAAQPADGVLGRSIQEALASASGKLATANIPVGGRIHHGIRIDGSGNRLPRAEITPQGDLLVDGKAVAVDEQQRKLLLEHRANLVAVAQAGIAIGAQGAGLGMQGAALGVKAAAGALKGALKGDTSEFEKQMEAEGQRIEAEGKRIEAEAERMICAKLPAVLASQTALAAALPAFAPYATMDDSDLRDCAGKVGPGFDPDSTTAHADAAAGTDADPVHDAAAEADAAARGATTKQ